MSAEAVVAEPGRQHLGVEGDERRDERLLVAHDDHLTDDRVRSDRVLERRGDVLAAGGDDDLLLASGDREEALVVERAESPVLNQSPSNAAAVASGLRQYSLKTLMPRTSTSPSSARRTPTPGRTGPTVPILDFFARLTVAAPWSR
jgi:hypothetical protein